METVILLLGGNLGDVQVTLQKAREALELRIGSLVQSSSLYQTAAWGKEDQPDFLNQVIVLSTEKSPSEILEISQEIEKTLGRQRFEHWGARTIDIDILYCGNQVIDREELRIPHPQIPHRKFTLVPLNEVTPDHWDPRTEKTVSQMLDETSDPLEVHLIKASLQE